MANTHFLEDILHLGAGAVKTLAASRHEVKARARQKAGALVRGLDLVERAEFDAAFAMIATARQAQEDLAARLARIEAHLELKEIPPSKPASKGKSRVKTSRRRLPNVKEKRALKG